MTPEEYRELRLLFDELEPLAPPAREKRLHEVLKTPDVRRAELESWLSAGDLLAQPEFEPLSAGTLVLNRYRIETRLGAGGFAVTYTALDTGLHRKKVVLKFPRLPDGADPEWFERHFVSEVRALASLNHPGIVAVLDTGEDPTAGAFAVLQWIDGPSLRELLSAGPLAPARAGRILLAAAQALHEAHAKGIVHRDLKPENIIVRAPGTAEEAPVLIDFGISTVPEDGVSLATTVIVGSPEYLAPEQAMGRPTTQSDIYALGCIAVELLTGQVVHRHLDLGEPKLAAELLLARHCGTLPKAVRGSLVTLLNLSATGRPASAAQLLPIFAALTRAIKRRQVHPRLKASAALLALAVIAAITWWWPHSAPDPKWAVIISALRTSPGLSAEPFALNGGTIHFRDRLRLQASLSLPAQLYLFSADSSSVSLLYPLTPIGPGTRFQIPAIASGAIEFDDTEETVHLWFCVSATPWGEMERIAAAARVSDGGQISDPSLWRNLLQHTVKSTVTSLPAGLLITGPTRFCGESPLSHRAAPRK